MRYKQESYSYFCFDMPCQVSRSSDFFSPRMKDTNHDTNTLTIMPIAPYSRNEVSVKFFVRNTETIPATKPIVAAFAPILGKKIPIKNKPPNPEESRPRISWKKSNRERMFHVAINKAISMPNTPDIKLE